MIKSLRLRDLMPIIGITLSLGTAHFVWFLKRFDIKMLTIVDYSAKSGYFLFLSIIAVTSMVSSRVDVYLLSETISLIGDNNQFRTHTEALLRVWETPYILANLLFVLLFTGFNDTMRFYLFTMAEVIAIFVLAGNARLLRRAAIGRKLRWYYPKLMCSYFALWKRPRKRLYPIFRPDNPTGIVIIFTFVVGVAAARSDYVKENHVFCIVDREMYRVPVKTCDTSIFLSAQNGIFVWDGEKALAFFIPWDSGVIIEAKGVASTSSADEP